MLKNKFIFKLQRFATITNETSNTLVSGTSDDDFISNFAANVTIDGGSGNDYISNGEEFNYEPDDEDDELEGFYEYEAEIEYFDELDSLRNNSINGGAGNDIIFNYGPNNTITGGAGNDSIYNFRYDNEADGDYSGGNDVVYKYAEGDGNDVITGFHDSSLEITEGTYSTTKSGSDIIVTVGDGKITLVGAANLEDEINIIGTEGTGDTEDTEDGGSSDPNLITLTEGDDTYTNTASDVKIKALGGNDYIVTDYTADETYYEYDVYYEYDYDEDDDWEEEEEEYYLEVKHYCGSTVSINGGSGNDSINNIFSYSTLEGGDGNDYILNTYTEYEDFVEDSYEGMLYSESERGHFSASAVLIDGGTGNDTIINDASQVTIDGGDGDDYITNTSYNYTSYYDDEDDDEDEDDWDEDAEFGNAGPYRGGEKVTIAGGTGNDTISNSGTNYVVFKYTEGDGNDSIVGFNANSTLEIGNGKDTYSKETIGKNIIVTVGEGKITLDGAASLSAVNIVGTEKIVKTNSWTLSGTTATYGTANNTLVTITGVKSLDGITLDGTTVTVSKASLNAKNVTVSDGYTLALADDVTNPTTTKAAWSLKSSTATYKSSAKTAGYTLANDGKSITYSKATTAETLATVTGVKSIKGLKLSGTTVTVAKSSLNAEKVTISKGYSLKLADDVTKTTTKAAWSLKSSTATYKQTTTAGYTLANNEINYTKKATTTLATVKGVKSLDGLSLSKKVVTVSKASLGTSKVTLSGDGYTLKLGSNVTKPTVKNAAWSLKSTTATYKGTATAGYTLANDAKSIAYTKKATTTLASVKGVKSTSGLKVNDKIITVSKASLGTSKITLSGDGYTLKLGSDVSKSTTKNAWGYSSSTATYKQTTSAGYSLATNSKSISYVKTSSTKTLATVKGAKSKSGLSVSNHVITLKNSALSNKVTVSGSYEFDFASDYKKATITGSSKADTITARGSNIKLNGGAGADSLSGGSSNDSINGGTGNDLIYGNKGQDTLVGGAGNDSLWGGAGNDSLYGGAGNDTFIYKPGEGTDTIFDYQSGDMLTILKSNGKEGGSFTSSSFKNGNLTLGISGGGSVIFDGVSKNGTFNINGDTYKISGSKLTQK